MPIRLFALRPYPEPLTLPDMSSPDAVTRQLPPGLYSTFRTYDRRRRVIGLRRHLQRLYSPAERLGIEPQVDAATLRGALAEALSDLETEEARLRLILTYAGEVYLVVEPFTPLPPEVYARGVAVITVPLHRERPGLKSTTFIQASQAARLRVVESGAFEALLTRNGVILEGLTSNFFYVQGGALGTAGRGVLPGVTRRLVLRLARRGGVPIRYRALPLAEIPRLEEAFLTSSSRGVVPIIQIDNQPVGSGGVGEVTRRLGEVYQAHVQKIAETIV